MRKRIVQGHVVQIDGKRGAYGVVFPNLPGCTAMGETIKAALANAEAALHDWTYVTKAAGRRISNASR